MIYSRGNPPHRKNIKPKTPPVDSKGAACRHNWLFCAPMLDGSAYYTCEHCPASHTIKDGETTHYYNRELVEVKSPKKKWWKL